MGHFARETLACIGARSVPSARPGLSAGIFAEHDPATAAGGGKGRQRGLGAYHDLPRAGGASQLLDAIGVHGGAGASIPEIAAARGERVRSLDSNVASIEREGLATLDAVPLEGLQKELRHGCITVVGIEY